MGRRTEEPKTQLITPQSSNKHFRAFSQDEREDLLDKAYRILQKRHFPHIIAFATAIHFSAVSNPSLVCKSCFEDVCQNFDHFLYNKKIYAQKKGLEYSKGLLIIDRGREKRYRDHYHEFKREKEARLYLGQVVDVPYFAPASETRMLQVADLVANAVYRYFERGITKEIDMIKHLFYTGSKQYPAPGLNHIINDACDCYACKFNESRRVK